MLLEILRELWACRKMLRRTSTMLEMSEQEQDAYFWALRFPFCGVRERDA